MQRVSLKSIKSVKNIKNKKLLAGIILTFCAALAWCRDVKIFVEDTDLNIPLEGAVIRSWDGTDYTCDEDGIVFISVPDGRQVSIQAIYPGYETGRLIIPLAGDSFTLGLSLGGVMEGKELVIEAQRPGVSETRSGRSVAISGEALERSSRIGVIEDVMTSIKLLPGVGYTGMFNAMPSIRGGDPGDLMAVLDGFYIENPYHWGGGFSIFDPNMISSAQLSHGIFSSRYGHTVSGLLEVSSKKADSGSAELELGLSTSAVNLNLAWPLGEKGGIMAMGKVTYWAPFVWGLKQLSKVVESETLQMINAVTTAPYIRSAEIGAHYRLNSDLELTAAVFAGTDGVGADYLNESNDDLVQYRSRMLFEWNNLQSFVISGLTYNPRPSMVLKTTLGAGFNQAKVDADMDYDYLTVYNQNTGALKYTIDGDDIDTNFLVTQTVTNVQGRADFDWSLGKGFLLGFGVQELYSQMVSEQEGKFFYERKAPGADYGFPVDVYVHYPVQGIQPEAKNRRFNSSAYALAEYASEGKKFGAELGLRVDHLYFEGKDFDIQTMPVLNPRLNLDYNVFRNRGLFDSLDLTVGTGLFSSVNDAISAITVDNGLGDFELRPNRSWTTVLGIKTDFAGFWSFNLEGYFKYVYDRAYQYSITRPGKESETVYRFNGDGLVWGFDAMLEKFESRYWNGWLSYTFSYAKYHQSERPVPNKSDPSGEPLIEESPWYYPSFHRFHNLNMVLNFKPSQKWNIYTRLGLASGMPKPEVGEITSYDVVMLDEDGTPTGQVITKYKRESAYSDNSRTTWSIPLDLKISYFIYKPRSKVQTEIYLAAENLFSLFYVAKANTSFNTYTGTEDTGSDSANYELPVPMVSFGMKWSF